MKIFYYSDDLKIAIKNFYILAYRIFQVHCLNSCFVNQHFITLCSKTFRKSPADSHLHTHSLNKIKPGKKAFKVDILVRAFPIPAKTGCSKITPNHIVCGKTCIYHARYSFKLSGKRIFITQELTFSVKLNNVFF